MQLVGEIKRRKINHTKMNEISDARKHALEVKNNRIEILLAGWK